MLKFFLFPSYLFFPHTLILIYFFPQQTSPSNYEIFQNIYPITVLMSVVLIESKR